MPHVAELVGGFSAVRAAEIAGITYRQLDYWARIGLVVPSLRTSSGSGDRRRYAADDVRLLAVCGNLPMDQRRRIVEAVRLSSGCRRFAVDKAGTVYCIGSDRDLLEAVRECRRSWPATLTLVDLDSILPELDDAEPSL